MANVLINACLYPCANTMRFSRDPFPFGKKASDSSTSFCRTACSRVTRKNECPPVKAASVHVSSKPRKAHAYGQRTGCFRAWPCTEVIILFVFLHTQESAFDEISALLGLLGWVLILGTRFASIRIAVSLVAFLTSQCVQEFHQCGVVAPTLPPWVLRAQLDKLSPKTFRLQFQISLRRA